MTVFFGIGVTGRFGNQIIEYIICKFLEHVHDIPVYHSKWLGNEFYVQNTPLYIIQEIDIEKIYMDSKTWKYMTFLRLHGLSMLEEIHPRKKKLIDIGPDDVFFSQNIDIQNKVLYHAPLLNTVYIKPYEFFIRSLFKFEDKYQQLLLTIKTEFFGSKQLVILHIRKGDFDVMINPYFVFVEKFYLQWLKANYHSASMQLYICGIFSSAIKDTFKLFAPIYLEDIYSKNPLLKSVHDHIDLVIDHGLMRMADVVLTSNSSFAFTACLLSDNSKSRFYRQDMPAGSLKQFDPWNSMSYEILPFGLRWVYYYLRYNPLFVFKFLWYTIKRYAKGIRWLDISYND